MNAYAQNSIRLILLVTLYLLGAELATWFIQRPDQVALIWAPSGLAFAALVVYGLRWWPFIAIAVLLLHLVLAPVPTLFLPFSITANVVEAVAGAWVVRRFAPKSIRELTIQSGFALLGGGLIQVLLGGPIGVSGMLIAGMIGSHDVLPALARWMMGDLFGVISVAPAAMMIMLRLQGEAENIPFRYARHLEKTLWLIGIAASLVLMLWLDTHSPSYALGMACLPLAMLLWSALRFEPLIASLANMLLAQTVAAFAGMGIGGFTMPENVLDSSIVVLFMCTITIVPQMLVGAAHQNRVAAIRLLRRATIDPLTRLPNRTAFGQQVRDRLVDSRRDTELALAYIDVDQFKVVNDIASHAAGDELIRVLAGALGSQLDDDELLARIGGDEFGLLLRRSGSERAVQRLESMREHVAELRVPWNEHVMSTSISVGLVPFRAGKQRFGDLLAQADAACFTAKELGGNRVQLASLGNNHHDEAVHARTSAMRWAMRLNTALEHGHFRLFCQSIASLHPADLHGRHFEVLVRMHDVESNTLLLPGSFIPAAERFNLSARLDRYVVEHTLAWLEAHPVDAADVDACCINLSAASVNSDDFERFLQQRIAASPLSPRQICFELTETSAVRDLARAQRFIQTVRGLGCRFALDDFGTGFCSFAYLQALDVDFFKIDGGFVRRLVESPLSLAIVRSIADIARVMDKQTIAECAESDAIRRRLAELGVNYAQGYAIDEPQPIDAYFAKAMPRPGD
ncbi:MAG: EAL domain-containing protein [Lysobacteraceae bacterium]